MACEVTIGTVPLLTQIGFGGVVTSQPISAGYPAPPIDTGPPPAESTAPPAYSDLREYFHTFSAHSRCSVEICHVIDQYFLIRAPA